jgi:hypothetical protein
MVRANCANRNAKIHALFHPIRRPEDRRSMHPPRPREAERVARWLLGQRRGRAGLGGAARAPLLRASLARIPETRGCDARSRVASEATDRGRIPANPDGARALQTARQRPASSRTTRKDFW